MEKEFDITEEGLVEAHNKKIILTDLYQQLDEKEKKEFIESILKDLNNQAIDEAIVVDTRDTRLIQTKDKLIIKQKKD